MRAAGKMGKPEQQTQLPSFLSRSEAATLLGMMLTIGSLFFVWEKWHVNTAGLAAAPALYKGEITLTRTAFGTAAHWPLTLCPLICGATLLWTPPRSWRSAVTALHIACALACLVIPLARFSPQPGVFIALIGGALLTFGAVDRFIQPAAPASA